MAKCPAEHMDRSSIWFFYLFEVIAQSCQFTFIPTTSVQNEEEKLGYVQVCISCSRVKLYFKLTDAYVMSALQEGIFKTNIQWVFYNHLIPTLILSLYRRFYLPAWCLAYSAWSPGLWPSPELRWPTGPLPSQLGIPPGFHTLLLCNQHGLLTW